MSELRVYKSELRVYKSELRVYISELRVYMSELRVYKFISQNCEFISQNCEFISQNCEKKSHNYFVYFFIQWRKRASIVFFVDYMKKVFKSGIISINRHVDLKVASIIIINVV